MSGGLGVEAAAEMRAFVRYARITGRPRSAWRCFGIAEWPGSGCQRSSGSPVVQADSDCSGAPGVHLRIVRCHPLDGLSAGKLGAGEEDPPVRAQADRPQRALMCYSVPDFTSFVKGKSGPREEKCGIRSSEFGRAGCGAKQKKGPKPRQFLIVTRCDC